MKYHALVPSKKTKKSIYHMTSLTPCNKIDKPLVVYRFTGNVMTSITTLRKIREPLDVFTPKMQFLVFFYVM